MLCVVHNGSHKSPRQASEAKAKRMEIWAMPTRSKPLPSLAILNRYLRLDADRGHLFWRARKREDFRSVRGYRCWTTSCEGKRADHRCSGGYYRVRLKIDGKWEIYGAHRIVWKMAHGCEPDTDLEIDHIDRNPSNNCPDNLRLVTRAANALNKASIERRQLSPNVYPSRNGKFRGQFYREGKFFYVGIFGSEREALAAVDHTRRMLERVS